MQEIEHKNQSMVEENYTLKDEIKELKEKLDNNPTLSNTTNKIEVKLIKKEMKKPIELDHEHHKRALHLIISGIKEGTDDDTLEIVKKQLKTNSQIQTNYLTEAKSVGKIMEHKHRLICVKVKLQ